VGTSFGGLLSDTYTYLSYNQYRLKAYHDAIKAKYPDITIIASTEQATFLPDGMVCSATDRQS
jgi:hypothetical protein